VSATGGQHEGHEWHHLRDERPDRPAIVAACPVDDGAARHLLGVRLPPLQLTSTDGGHLDLGAPGDSRAILYVYPMTATPGRALPHG
jgi:hypothetical protein